jgi:5-methylcytosine-specific restriction endonuclease McrA
VEGIESIHYMGARQREWARLWRARLIRILGAKCACCGAVEKLELDCIRPVRNAHARYEASTRVSFYRRQWSVGNLQILCSSCNVIKTDRIISIPDLLREVNLTNNSVNPVNKGRYEEKDGEEKSE